jgi:hypothetical protein
MIRYNPDQIPNSPKILIKDRDTLVLERLQVALEHASRTFDERSLLTVEYLFYYDIPNSTRDHHVQTLRFKDEHEYNAWFNIARPLIEQNEDRKQYARLAHIPIAKAKEHRARVKHEKLRQHVSNVTVLDRVQFPAAAKMPEAGE